MDFPPRGCVSTLAATPRDSMSTLEIVVLVAAALVVGFAAGRLSSLRKSG